MEDLVATDARVNITYAGENGDLPDPVNFDSADHDIRAWVTEAVANGSVPGIPADQNANFTDFVIDRFNANEDRPYNLIQVRPKTPFGRECACPWCSLPAEEGCEAFFSGEPVCREHDYRRIFEMAREAVASLASKK